jgi:hypothetical protein
LIIFVALYSMKAYKLNSNDRTISEIIINGFKEIIKEIGNDCESFICPIILPNNDVIYADYHGYYKTNNNAIMHPEYSLPIFGNVIVIGMNNHGSLSDVSSEISTIDQVVSFLSHEFAKRIYNTQILYGATMFSKN